MKKRSLHLIAVLVLMAMSCIYGIIIHRHHVFPYRIAKTIHHMLTPPSDENKATIDPEIKANPEFNDIKPLYFKTDVDSIISIREPDDIPELRNRLVRFIWGESRIPTSTLPAHVDTDFKDERYNDLYAASLRRIDRIVVDMEFGLQSYVYHFIPNDRTNRIILFHQGHRGDFILNKVLISELLDRGYAVAAFCMPLLGLNNLPTVFLPRFGYLRLSSHDHMKFLVPERGHPVKYFVEPVIVLLNYVTMHHGYSDAAMIGISGGGWTTELAAALDTRIKKSISIAGTHPIYLRSESTRDWGDWEQVIPELYSIANYLELYLLGSCGNGRSQLQVFNKYDACCFAGIRWQTYQDRVRNRLASLGSGKWDLFLDDSHADHHISAVTRARILSELTTQ